MKPGILSILPALLLGTAALAQGNAPGGPPRIVSPVVQPDGRVTFSLRAPNATSVSLTGDFPLVGDFHGGRKLTNLTKDADGVWSVTVGPLKPDVYDYGFSVDGVKALDPSNVRASHASRFSNWFIVPGPMPANYQINDVPHGRVSEVWYPSATLKTTRRVVVYTPPGYEAGTGRYPVFYLYHGGGEDELAWPSSGRAPEILDNLIAQGKTVPMIVVMPSWSVSNDLAPSDGPVTRTSPPAAVPPTGPDSQALWQEVLVKDLIPFVDKSYRTYADRDHRAVAGTSAGGTQAILTGLQHSDLFSWLGLLSPALARVPNAEIKIPLPADAATRRGPDLGVSIDPVKFAANFPVLGPDLNKRMHLIYFSVGGSEGLIEEELAGRKVFDEKGVKYQWVTRPGYGHEWAFWRQDLVDFSQELFKPTPPPAR